MGACHLYALTLNPQLWETDVERFFSPSPNMATQYTPVAYAVFQRCSPPKSPNSGGLQL